jgi:hypothetical protein
MVSLLADAQREFYRVWLPSHADTASLIVLGQVDWIIPVPVPPNHAGSSKKNQED